MINLGISDEILNSGYTVRVLLVIQTKIFSLPDSTQIFPAHDYRGFTSSTVGEEKKFNPRIGAGKSREEFIQIMRNLKLADPKKMDVAVPANLECGRKILF